MEQVRTTRAIFRDKHRRVWELDFLRGVAVIAMCFDHLMCDFLYLPGWFSNYNQVQNPFIMKMAEFAKAYWNTTYTHGFRFYAHYLFVFVFLFLVGTSCALSRNNTRRGSLLFLFSLAFTGVTFVLKSFGIFSYGIVWGILHCIALSILCVSAVDELTKFDKRLNMFAPLAIGVIICAVGIEHRFWEFGGKNAADEVFNGAHLIEYILGTVRFGDDWFGLFPYVGAVFLGVYCGKALYAPRVSLMPALDGKWNKPINFVGRHALVMYVLHQIVLAGLVGVVCLCLGYRF